MQGYACGKHPATLARIIFPQPTIFFGARDTRPARSTLLSFLAILGRKRGRGGGRSSQSGMQEFVNGEYFSWQSHIRIACAARTGCNRCDLPMPAFAQLLIVVCAVRCGSCAVLGGCCGARSALWHCVSMRVTPRFSDSVVGLRWSCGGVLPRRRVSAPWHLAMPMRGSCPAVVQHRSI